MKLGKILIIVRLVVIKNIMKAVLRVLRIAYSYYVCSNIFFNYYY